MSLYDKLNDDPRVQNCFPKFIAVVDRKHVVLAEVVSGQVYLTHEGEAFFADAPAEEAEKPTKKPRAKKAAPVEAPESPEITADDLGEIPDFLDDLDVGE